MGGVPVTRTRKDIRLSYRSFEDLGRKYGRLIFGNNLCLVTQILTLTSGTSLFGNGARAAKQSVAQ